MSGFGFAGAILTLRAYVMLYEKHLGSNEMKKNCWEVKECGREPGGRVAVHMGVCPAAEKSEFDGLHGGKNSGRACWLVAGTLCGGKPQGTFAQKLGTCELCDFFQMVESEEQDSFVSTKPGAAEESD
jgi:hypothetical protein